jgi:hypothetical protein
MAEQAHQEAGGEQRDQGEQEHRRQIAASTTSERSHPSLRAISSIADAIEPGPAIIGMPIGKTEMSSCSGSALHFLGAALAALGAALEHHVESDQEQHDPAGDPEGGEADARACLSKPSPSKAKKSRMPAATAVERAPSTAAAPAASPGVRLAKIGAQPGGSITTKKVAKAEANSSIMR